jgi:phosphoglucosamine mutase
MEIRFGTDGVRGEANVDLTPEAAFQLGRAGAHVLTKDCGHGPKIIIGTDTRLSGAMLEAAITAGLLSVGADVLCAGVLPTPGVAALTRKYGCDAGVVISASHNGFEDNGIKFFNGSGYKLKDGLEREIERLAAGNNAEVPVALGAGIGRRSFAVSAEADYTAEIKKAVSPVNFSGLSIALDCANGAAHKTAPAFFSGMGASVTVLANEPDGTNINENCGSTHIEKLADLVKGGGFDAGFAFDGDGDRLIAVDEKGGVVDGDQILSILGLEMKKEGRLKGNTIVATVMSNLGLLIMGRERGINIEQTGVGDRYVLERMLENGYNLGGEQSGHIIFLDYATTGDGLLTAALTAKVMAESGKRLTELNSVMERLPQVLINALVPHEAKETAAKDKQVASAVKAAELALNGEGRVLVRPSGTEAAVRVMIEGRDLRKITETARDIARLIENSAG